MRVKQKKREDVYSYRAIFRCSHDDTGVCVTLATSVRPYFSPAKMPKNSKRIRIFLNFEKAPFDDVPCAGEKMKKDEFFLFLLLNTPSHTRRGAASRGRGWEGVGAWRESACETTSCDHGAEVEQEQ